MISKSICGLRSPPGDLGVLEMYLFWLFMPAYSLHYFRHHALIPSLVGIGTQQGNSPAIPGEASEACWSVT